VEDVKDAAKNKSHVVVVAPDVVLAVKIAAKMEDVVKEDAVQKEDVAVFVKMGVVLEDVALFVTVVVLKEDVVMNLVSKMDVVLVLNIKIFY